MKKFLLPCMLAIFLCSGCAIHTQKEVDEMQEDYDKKYEDYEDKIADYEDEIDEYKDQETDYQEQIATLTEENEELKIEYDALILENGDLSNQVDEMAAFAESMTNNSSMQQTGDSLADIISQGQTEELEEIIPDDLDYDLCVVSMYVLSCAYGYLMDGESLDDYYAYIAPYIYDFYAMDTGNYNEEEQAIFDDTLALWLTIDSIYYDGETADLYDEAITELADLFADLTFLY